MEALLHAIEHSSDAASAALAAAFEGDINASSVLVSNGYTPLVAAVVAGKAKTIHALGARGDVNPNQLDSWGQLPLCQLPPLYDPELRTCSRCRIARALLAAFPGTIDVNCVQASQCDALYFAVVIDNDFALARLLLDNGADADHAWHSRAEYFGHDMQSLLSKHMEWKMCERAQWLRACVVAAGATTTIIGAVYTPWHLPRRALRAVQAVLRDTSLVANVDTTATHHLVGEYALVIALFLPAAIAS